MVMFLLNQPPRLDWQTGHQMVTLKYNLEIEEEF